MSIAMSATDEALELLDAMDLLFSEAKAAEERRLELRVPFLRLVSIRLPGSDDRELAAVTRDLSPMGLGLLHSEPIEPGDVTMTIPVETDEPMTFAVRIKWCQPIGPGWYMSGGKFVKLLPRM